MEDSYENHNLIEQIAICNNDSRVVICGGRSVEVLRVKNDSCMVLGRDYRYVQLFNTLLKVF